MPFTAYFDASGKEEGQPCIVVAGFVAPEKDWIQFSKLWKNRLEADGLHYFRMAELAHSVKGFAHGWKNNEPRRRKLLGDLMEIVQSHVSRKFACVIYSESLSPSISEEMGEHYKLTAYVLAGRTCAGEVRQWATSERIITPIRLVFEEGDAGKGKLIERLNRDAFQTPHFEYKKDTREKGVLHPASMPLHAADWFAYEMFKAAKERTIRRKWVNEEFERIPGVPGFFSANNLKDFDTKLRVSRDTARWWNKLVKAGLDAKKTNES